MLQENQSSKESAASFLHLLNASSCYTASPCSSSASMLPSVLMMPQVVVGWTSGFDAAGEKDFKSNEIIKYFTDISEQTQRQKDCVCLHILFLFH